MALYEAAGELAESQRICLTRGKADAASLRVLDGKAISRASFNSLLYRDEQKDFLTLHFDWVTLYPWKESPPVTKPCPIDPAHVTKTVFCPGFFL